MLSIEHFTNPTKRHHHIIGDNASGDDTVIVGAKTTNNCDDNDNKSGVDICAQCSKCFENSSRKGGEIYHMMNEDDESHTMELLRIVEEGDEIKIPNKINCDNENLPNLSVESELEDGDDEGSAYSDDDLDIECSDSETLDERFDSISSSNNKSSSNDDENITSKPPIEVIETFDDNLEDVNLEKDNGSLHDDENWDSRETPVTTPDCINDFLDKCSDNAEARLAARRQARAEAREIRMRELERQQREQEENADRVYDMYADPVTRSAATTRLATGTRSTMLSNSSYHSSRRSSEDSLEDGGSLRDIRMELRELEDKFRKAMIANAQLDNDKASYTYQIELLKDRLEDLEQDHSQLQREHRDKCREFEQLKRVAAKLKDDLTFVKFQLDERDTLIAEKGLVIISCEENGDGIENGSTANHNGTLEGDEDELGAGGDINSSRIKSPKKALVSLENAALLESAGEGSLDVRLKKFSEEKKDLEDKLRSLRIELDEERNKTRRRRSSNNSTLIGNSITHNGPEGELLDNMDILDIQREANKQLADYKFKMQKAEQDIASLQGAVARLESQVVRYRAAAEASERAEDELKVEKRKLQREARESQSRVEELETANSHLQKRLDKLKNAKSTLLKEL